MRGLLVDLLPQRPGIGSLRWIHLLRQPARQPPRRCTIALPALRTGVELYNSAGDGGGAEHHQQDEQQRQPTGLKRRISDLASKIYTGPLAPDGARIIPAGGVLQS